jgi:type IV pilus assembly protein PilC
METENQVFKKPIIARVNRRTVAATCRQLSVLIDVGIPLLKALKLLASRISNPTMARVIGEVAHSIEKGNTLASAMASHPKIFSGLFVNVVRVGEVGGNLEEALRRLADYLERDNSIRKKIIFSLFYPAVVLGVSISMIGFIMVWVMPRFKEIYDDRGIDLPAITSMVLDMSEFFQQKWIFLLLFAVALVVVFFFYRKMPSGRKRIDSFKLRLPIYGVFYSKIISARICRTFATLVRSGVPMVSCLKVVGQTAGNVAVDTLFEETSRAVERGENLARTLAGKRIFPPLMIDMIAVGESAGSLDKVLEKVADSYEEEVNLTLDSFAAILEPVMIVILGGITLLLAMAILLPYLSLSSSGVF